MTKKEALPLPERWLTASAALALESVAEAAERAQDLVDAWVRAGNAEAVSEVAERGGGAVRKAARRGLNVLGARGVKVPSAPHVASLAGPVGETVTEAWLLPPEPSGWLLFVIAARSPARRAQSVFLYGRDGSSVERVTVGELSGSGLKDALKRASRYGVEPVRVPVEYARRRIADLRARHKELGQPEPLGMGQARELLEPVPAEEQPHPFDGEGLELAEEDAHDLAQRSRELHQLPAFVGWFPERSAVEEMLGEVGKRMTPGQQPEPAEINAMLLEATDAATDRYFQPERRATLARFMKDAALSVLASHGEVRALEVVAAMQAVERAGLITHPPHEVPFLRAFFEKALAAMLMENGGRLRVPVRAGAGTDDAEPPADPLIQI